MLYTLLKYIIHWDDTVTAQRNVYDSLVSSFAGILPDSTTVFDSPNHLVCCDSVGKVKNFRLHRNLP